MPLFKGIRLDLAKRSLESSLSKILEIMGGHKDAGLPAGHEHYKKLMVRAQKAIVKYQDTQTKFGVPVSDYSDIAASIPALRDLEGMAEGNAEGGIPQKAGAIAIASLLGTFAITFVWALNHDLYMALTHWANVHWAVR